MTMKRCRNCTQHFKGDPNPDLQVDGQVVCDECYAVYSAALYDARMQRMRRKGQIAAANEEHPKGEVETPEPKLPLMKAPVGARLCPRCFGEMHDLAAEPNGERAFGCRNDLCGHTVDYAEAHTFDLANPPPDKLIIGGRFGSGAKEVP